jgi:alpha-D-xyloside xylohydrolase
LRYRLLPYLYSVAWQVTFQRRHHLHAAVGHGFSKDPQVIGIGDQYLFGPAIMVTPSPPPGRRRDRSICRPAARRGSTSGPAETSPAGQRVEAAAPVETLPLFVRPGSIIPMGPFLQYSSEKPADPIELRIYRGADGAFTLYEDEGDNYNYEKGKYATIPISWNEPDTLWKLANAPARFPAC